MNDRTHKNILGSEMEWGAAARLEGSTKFIALNGDGGTGPTSRMWQDCLYEGIVGHGNYLSNGSRLYNDVGGHMEYATPENITLDDMVLSELAGERLVAESLRRYVANHERIEEVVLYKRVIDDEGRTWGYHMNISEDRPAFIQNKSQFVSELAEKVRPLALHYATSLAILGSGAVQKIIKMDEGPEYRYSLGQKVNDIECDFSSNTTRAKPFINSRDEPHANSDKYMRLHIVGTDPHISPWATKMAFGTSALLLAAVRQGRLRQLGFGVRGDAQAIRLARLAKYDIEGNNLYEFTEDGERKNYTVSDVQDILIEDVKKVSGLTDEHQWVIEEWEKASTDRRNDVMRLADRSDSIAKLDLIGQMQTKLGEGSLGQTAMNIDKAYTTTFHATKDDAQKLDTRTLINRTLSGKLRNGQLSAEMKSEEEIIGRVVNAPVTTRAHVRGEILQRKAAGTIDLTGMEWASYTHSVDGRAQYVKLDPYDTV